ncbi:MAG: DUF5615 family PIN-like protein [Ginsengibacter sp.]
MNLLADEGVDKPIVNALRLAGFNVVYIMETNRGAEDSLILNLANDQKRVLLTQDKDFGELVFRLKQAHYGVVLIRLEGYLSTLKAEITVNVILKYKNELISAFTVIQPNAIRIRK